MTAATLLDTPTVTVHYAQTLDGRIATRTGHSQWISGDESRMLQHRLRAEHDAILVGVGTVLADDPRLTVRLVDGPCPRRVVVDSSLRIRSHCNLLTDGAAPTLVATTSSADPARVALVRSRGAEVAVLPPGAGGVDLIALLERLGQSGVRSVLVEGGASLVTTLLQLRLVSRLIVCIAPKVIGTGIEAVGDLAVLRLGDALALQQLSVQQLGADVIVDGRLPTNARVPSAL